jgi:hypothetical protein
VAAELGPDRCGAPSRLTHNSRRPSELSSRRLQAGPIGAPSIRRDADRRIDRSPSPAMRARQSQLRLPRRSPGSTMDIEALVAIDVPTWPPAKCRAS